MSSPSDPGWTRRRAGKGFVYLDRDKKRLGPDESQRCRDLVIPPAWIDVWICPYANGHLQAVGTDVRGRRQYLYHPQWRIKRDLAKHDRVLKVARRLPDGRTQALTHLGSQGMSVERAMATAFRLLDLGYFRVGSDSYTTENGSYGLTTIERRHVRREGKSLVFEFTAKSGVLQHIEIVDPLVGEAVEAMRRRRGGDPTLLAYKLERRWLKVSADAVNEYLKTLLGDDVSAKDFRTWHGTVHAAVALAGQPAKTKTGRKRGIAAAMREVADHLGNTPTVARASYVDGRIIDLYEDGKTIAPALKRIKSSRGTLEAKQAAIERAVLRLLR